MGLVTTAVGNSASVTALGTSAAEEFTAALLTCFFGDGLTEGIDLENPAAD
ncbi:hypothetical protein [Dendrosporobacter sp. 1207_IL3150]|uniref:hypothetical protein n=1 Tax=Dendrosporobacter sp. 1207_IL3150 TaxID=3084054 RepID=UPI002FD994C6